MVSGEHCICHIAIDQHTDHAMVVVQGVLLQVTQCQLQGQKQSPLHCNAHPDLAFGGQLVCKCEARPLVSVVCWCFRHLYCHRRANPRATNTESKCTSRRSLTHSLFFMTYAYDRYFCTIPPSLADWIHW